MLPKPIIFKILDMVANNEQDWLTIILLNKEMHRKFTKNYYMKRICPKFKDIRDKEYEIYKMVLNTSKMEYDVCIKGPFAYPKIKTYFGIFYLHDMHYSQYSTSNENGGYWYLLREKYDSKEKLKYILSICKNINYFHNSYHEQQRKKTNYINYIYGFAVGLFLGIFIRKLK